jgi:hypothetical protein
MAINLDDFWHKFLYLAYDTDLLKKINKQLNGEFDDEDNETVRVYSSYRRRLIDVFTVIDKLTPSDTSKSLISRFKQSPGATYLTRFESNAASAILTQLMIIYDRYQLNPDESIDVNIGKIYNIGFDYNNITRPPRTLSGCVFTVNSDNMLTTKQTQDTIGRYWTMTDIEPVVTIYTLNAAGKIDVQKYLDTFIEPGVLVDVNVRVSGRVICTPE